MSSRTIVTLSVMPEAVLWYEVCPAVKRASITCLGLIKLYRQIYEASLFLRMCRQRWFVTCRSYVVLKPGADMVLGDTCGAVILDAKFKKLLRTELKEGIFDSLPPLNVSTIMRDFENGIRKVFDGTDNTLYTISLPGVVDASDSRIQANMMSLDAYVESVWWVRYLLIADSWQFHFTSCFR